MRLVLSRASLSRHGVTPKSAPYRPPSCSRGPSDHTESVLDEAYVRSNFQGRRSSQHTRNQLLSIKNGGEFEEFTEFVTERRPEIEELSVETREGEKPGYRELDVFVRERGDRTPKELYWVGDGVQIFVQILTHLWRLRSADVVILDEPDLYLHADLQRRPGAVA